MLFCMCMTMNAQGLKTYSGDFSMVAGGFHFPGKATYTYKNADDGTRIYEGNFSFTRVIRPNVCYNKVVGKYHNDLKNGLWTYTTKTIGTTEQLRVCYSEGIVDGIYEYSKVEKNVTRKSFKGVIKNGVPIGPISGKLISAFLREKISASEWVMECLQVKPMKKDCQTEHGNLLPNTMCIMKNGNMEY